jgi:hypothetical protein
MEHALMLELLSKRIAPMFATLKLWMIAALTDYGISLPYTTLWPVPSGQKNTN